MCDADAVLFLLRRQWPRHNRPRFHLGGRKEFPHRCTFCFQISQITLLFFSLHASSTCIISFVEGSVRCCVAHNARSFPSDGCSPSLIRNFIPRGAKWTASCVISRVGECALSKQVRREFAFYSRRKIYSGIAPAYESATFAY